jgi:hypothetical protein
MLQVFGVAAVPSEQHEVGSKNIKEGHLRILSFDMVQQNLAYFSVLWDALGIFGYFSGLDFE